MALDDMVDGKSKIKYEQPRSAIPNTKVDKMMIVK